MDIKADQRASASASATDLAHADKQIDSLFQKHLPAIPHIFFVPTNNPYRPNFPHENLNIPFERCEIPKLQYMTLISNGDRGVGASKGASDWEEEVYGKSPLSATGHSSTSTPNPMRDPKKPSQKISFGDYKNFKQTGVKPSPRPYTATPEQKARQDMPAHSRNTSAVSTIIPMDRVPSIDGGDLKPAVANVNSVTLDKAHLKEAERSTISRSPHIDPKEAEKTGPITNGHHATLHNTSKDSKVELRGLSKLQNPTKESIKHPLPPRPQSPPRSNPEQKKRPLELGETHPEKRVKIGHGESRTPSNPQREAPRKSETATSDIKPSPTKIQKSTTASSLPKRPIGTAKPIDTKPQTPKPSKSDKPLEIPPLLSPLPADLGPSPEPYFAIKKSDSDKVTPPKTPSKKHGFSSDTIVVKPLVKSHAAAYSPVADLPKPSSPPFVLPSLLSPGLPPVVEEELLRLQQKSATLNTVEARHEKARLPDAPGVARKTPRNAKVGHPPKRTHGAESSKLPSLPEKEAKKTLIVKIPYKKRAALSIQRILTLTQKPRGQMEKLEAGERQAREKSTSAAPPPKDESESEDDIPLSQSRATKTPSTIPPPAKKRPIESTDRSDPAPKRLKFPEVDVAKASTPVTPAFKSPAMSNPSASAQKSVAATPKKGDAMKSVTVAMRRVDSNDGLARTPQTASTSTPASAEKHRPNGIEARPNPELEKQRADEARFYPMGTMLKRKMDSIIMPKARDPSIPISESERKVGLCIGVESLMAYMLTFHARDRIAHLRSVPPDPTSWEGFVRLQAFFVHSTKQYTELYALIEQLGAVAREMQNRVYMEHLVLLKDGGKIEKIGKEIRDNSRARDAAWSGVKRNGKVLRRLGIEENLGPVSSVHDAVAMAAATLTAYCAKEKLDWSPDAQFAAARESGSGSGPR